MNSRSLIYTDRPAVGTYWRSPFYLRLLSLCGLLVMLPASAGFVQTNLVADTPGLAAFTDPDLVNPWGLAASPTSFIWVSDAGSGVSTLYTGSGVKQALVVAIPPPAGGSGLGTPTGQVFNGGTGFHGDRFIFATEEGTLAGWRSPFTSAELAVDNAAGGAIYKGLAIGNNGSADYLYAADFHHGKIDIFDSGFAAATLTGSFIDPTLPAGYAPFNIQNLGGDLYVTFAMQDATAQDELPGTGRGFVDVFDTNGQLKQRLVSNGVLDAPWGLALAPAGFGPFGGNLLVGNFGDGRINAFDVITGDLLGPLLDDHGNPLAIEGLWGLMFGKGSANGGPANALYFTAGPGDESHGLFGTLTFRVPEPLTPVLIGLGLGLIGLGRSKWGLTTNRPTGAFGGG